jgi:hypothetical protein
MVEGERYIIAGLEEADWVKNARVAGWGSWREAESKCG